MRFLVLIATIALCWAAPVTGVAHAATPGTTITDDGFGVLLGSPDAPTQWEIFCEPQCPDCARFETTSGDTLAERLADGQLAVTYRWLTFLDARRDNTVSARISTALMAAAEPATPAAAYQGFVTEVYRNQNSTAGGPSPTDLATMAARNGVAPLAIARIAVALPIVDTAAMNTANRERLKQANPENPSTPTIYDLNTRSVVAPETISGR